MRRRKGHRDEGVQRVVATRFQPALRGAGWSVNPNPCKPAASAAAATAPTALPLTSSGL